MADHSQFPKESPGGKSVVQIVVLFILIAWLAVLAGYGYWLGATEDFKRGIAQPLLVIVGAVSIFLWWVLFIVRGWKKKLAWLGASLAVPLVLGILFRYADSADGLATPSFVWRWSKPEREHLAAIDDSAAVEAEARKADAEKLASWPQYLGADRTGEIEGIELSRDWVATPPRLVWKKTIGPGWSGFVVEGIHAVTQEQRDDLEMVTCYNVRDGALMWKHENHARFDTTMGGVGPRATPTIFEGRVYTVGATGILDCLDLETGKLIWTRNILDDTGRENIDWGKSGSPLIHGETVIVTGGAKGGPSLLAYDLKTGEKVWEAGEDGASFSSPVVETVAGREQILCVNDKSVTGHDPESGAVLWRFPWPGGEPKVAQPRVVEDNRVLVTASYGIDGHLLEVTPGDEGGSRMKVKSLWGSKALKTKFSSAVIRDGYAYGLSEGIFTCMSLEDGDRVWKGGRYGFGQNLLVGDIILVMGERGEIVLIEPTPEEHREVARFDALEGKTWNPPALAGAYLLLRNAKEAACYELPLAGESKVTSR